jgi:hypothetical protein
VNDFPARRTDTYRRMAVIPAHGPPWTTLNADRYLRICECLRVTGPLLVGGEADVVPAPGRYPAEDSEARTFAPACLRTAAAETRPADSQCVGGAGINCQQEERRVVAYPAEQGGAAGVLPGQAEHIQAGRGRHAPLVHDASLAVLRLWDVDPRVVHREPGWPTPRRRSPRRCRRRRSRSARPRSPPGAGSGCRGGGRASAARARSPGPARPAAFLAASRRHLVQPQRGRPGPDVAAERPLGDGWELLVGGSSTRWVTDSSWAIWRRSSWQRAGD